MTKINVDKVRNSLEARILKDFYALEKATKYKDLTYEEETLPYTTTYTYIPDFVVTRADGHKIYIEVKGYFRRDDESKLLAVRASNPGIDLRILFDVDNRCVGRRMRYSDWAKKHGFICAFKHLPKEWLLVPET